MKNLSFFEIFDYLWRFFVAHFFTFFFLILSLVSFSFPLTGQIRPCFILIVLYYWSINRPAIIPPVVVFVIGIFYDLIIGFPIGLHSILFLSLYWVVKSQRLFFMGQPYMIVWLSFIFTTAAILFLEYLFFSGLNGHWLAITPLFNSFLLTAFTFPVVTLILIIIQRILPKASTSLI